MYSHVFFSLVKCLYREACNGFLARTIYWVESISGLCFYNGCLFFDHLSFYLLFHVFMHFLQDFTLESVEGNKNIQNQTVFHAKLEAANFGVPTIWFYYPLKTVWKMNLHKTSDLNFRAKNLAALNTFR